jgi:hypothetical protein
MAFQVGPFQTNFQQAAGGTPPPVVSTTTITVGDGGLPWADEVRVRFRRRELQRELARAKRQEQKLGKLEAKLLRKVESEKRQSHPVEGILAKYWDVSLKIEAKRAEIQGLEIEFRDITHFLDDEDEIEALLLE